ncbi:centrosomal protein of 131 kDa-like [Haliotis cracherodii]|uniref:centrosomal protein of 131 kDa-like n=1 Tax=Haliotis cracherodii TaxID=6455 RepID=UPI0039EA5375
MSRRSVNGDDLDLSLTGSQISSSGRRPGSGRQLKRPNSLVDIRTAKTSSSNDVFLSDRDKRKSPRGPPAPVSGRGSDVSGAASSRISGRKKDLSAKEPNVKDDFLALFESSHQPKIKRPGSTPSKVKKPGASSVKTAWEQQPSKPAVPSGRTASARSEAADTDRTEPHNIFQPDTADSSSDDLDQIEDTLSRSLNRLQSLQNQLSEANKNNSSSTDDPEVLNSQRSNRSTSRKNMNSIVNNMTAQGHSTKTRPSLSSMENSYQNIKPKAPVNQVRKAASNQVGMNVAEDYIQTLNTAALKIQRWFRRHYKRKMVSEAAMRRLFDQKRQEHAELRQQELAMSTQESDEQRADERKKQREEKARQARLQAIQELQKKRSEKREEVKKKAEEEVAYLQASGKITKSPSRSSLAKKKGGSRNGSKRGASSPREGQDNASQSTPRDGGQNGSAAPGTVEDMFQMPSSHREEAEGAGAEPSPRLPSPSQAATRSTLNDLFDTLKKLEEEENFVTPRAEKRTSWLTELEKRKEKEDCIESNLTAENLEKLNSKHGLKQSGFLTDGKLKSIMTFLDEVQVSDRLSEIDTEINKMNEELEKPALLVPSGEELAQLEQAQAVASEVTSTVLSQRLELDEKRRTVTMLQKALNQQRELTVRHARETEKEMKKRLDHQKEEYEETVKRHLGFIDQLIDDKKTLSERCEQVVKELKVIDKKYQDKIKSMDDSHGREMQKLKDIHAAAEKLRREKWIEEKTKKIKEMTVKGLEPEIQRLIAKHKAEIKKIKQLQEGDILESDERASHRYVKMMEELREQLEQEKEAACNRERQMAKERYEKQLQQEEESYQQQRRRLHAEVQEEKERLSQHASRQRTEVDKLQRQLEDSHKMALDAMKSEFEKAREEQDRRHAIEVRELNERLRVEKEAWEENYMKKQETWLTQKERELKSHVRRDRDKEIELVIQRLEEDATRSRDECERAAENRIKRMRDKFNNEMKELESSERHAVQKYNEMKAQLTEIEGECERLKVIVRQKDQEVLDIKKLTDRLHEERSHVSDIIRQEFADRIVTTEEENKRLKNEMSELRAKHRIEIERGKSDIEEIKRQKDDEMEEVHKRVKQAIVKKEEVVNQLRQQYQAATKRADHLEGLLNQQRKQLLGKKAT